MSYPTFWTTKKLSKLKSLYDSGLSMREVGLRFDKSVRSIASVMKRKNITRRLTSQTRYTQFIHSPLSFMPKTSLNNNEMCLKIAGLMLYWAEGAKKNKNGQVNFTNADPNMIKFFTKFLRDIYQVNESKLRCHLYCFDDQSLKNEINFWSELTQIPPNQFIKPYIATNKNPSHDKISHGVCHIVYSDKRLFDLILLEIYKLIDTLNC